MSRVSCEVNGALRTYGLIAICPYVGAGVLGGMNVILTFSRCQIFTSVDLDQRNARHRMAGFCGQLGRLRRRSIRRVDDDVAVEQHD